MSKEQTERDALARELHFTFCPYETNFDAWDDIADFILARERESKNQLEAAQSLNRKLQLDLDGACAMMENLPKQLKAAREAFDGLLIPLVLHLTPEIGQKLNVLAQALVATQPEQKGGVVLDYVNLYNELIYNVVSKHPNESRHQTALRYIREAEESAGESDA